MRKILIILSCLLLLTGCSNNTTNNQRKEKVKSEIEYFSTQIAELFNNLNNISLENYELISEKVSMNTSNSEGGKSQFNSGQSTSPSSNQASNQSNEDSAGNESQSVSITSMASNSILKRNTEDIDWDLMRTGIENINTSWSVVMLDLYNANVSNDDIKAFGNTLDTTIISIKNEDKIATLRNLNNLYSYIPKFLTSISSEKHDQNIETTKYYIFMAYSAASQDDWTGVATNLSNAENNFLNVLNDMEYSKNREFKINKTYLLIKELQNSIANKDKQLFFLKYINLMENMNTLQ